MRRTHLIAPVLLAALSACDPMNPATPGNLVPRTVTEDASLPAITLNGTRFHAQTMGNPANPAIVFLHGGPGGDYRSLLRMADRFGGYSLADDYYLVFWDQRGSGLSERHNKALLTVDVYDSDLSAIVDHYSPGRPVILIGHSWGGMFATEFINRHPERVAGAVLIEPGPLTGPSMERLKDDLLDMDFRREWLNDVAWSSQFFSADDHERMDYDRMIGDKASQPRSNQRFSPDPEPSWRAGGAASRFLPESGQDANGRFNFDFTTDLARYSRPVLFLAGERSEVLGASLQRDQVKLYRSATLQVVPGAGHDVNWTHAADVLAHVRSYLNVLKGGSQ